METAITDPLVITGAKQEFQKSYKKSYLDAWETFGAQVPNGIQRLAGKPDWQKVIDRIAVGQDPYFAFLGRLKDEISPFSENTDRAWIGLVENLEATRLEAAGQDAVQKTGLLSQAAQKGKNLLTQAEKLTGNKDASKLIESIGGGNSSEKLPESPFRAFKSQVPPEKRPMTSPQRLLRRNRPVRHHRLSRRTHRFARWKTPSKAADPNLNCSGIWYPVHGSYSGISFAGKPPVILTSSGKEKFWSKLKASTTWKRSTHSFWEKKGRQSTS